MITEACTTACTETDTDCITSCQDTAACTKMCDTEDCTTTCDAADDVCLSACSDCRSLNNLALAVMWIFGACGLIGVILIGYYIFDTQQIKKQP